MTQAALLALAIVMPDGLPDGPLTAGVLCRDADRRWPAMVWQPYGTAPRQLTAPTGAACRVLIRPAGSAGLLASREVIWEARAEPIRVESGWLREVSAAGLVDNLSWLGEAEVGGVECDPQPEPRCLFVPFDMPGVLVAEGAAAFRHAVVPAGVTRAAWSVATAARLVRVAAPGAQPVSARAITIGPLLKRGSHSMVQARPEPAVRITPVGLSAVWVEGTAPGAFIELRSRGAAPSRIPLAGLLVAPALPLEVRLLPEETLEGEVRADGVAVEGATVLLWRIDERPSSRKDDPPRLERVAEAVTDAVGRFRFQGLGRERHELLAVHPSWGRARAVVTPPGFPRLVLKPRARVRGRVVANGIPVPAAIIRVLPSLETIAAAPNPLLLASAPAASGPDGRFDVIVPDEGRVVLAIHAGERVQRVDLGDAASMGEVIEIGDIRLEEPQEIEILIDLPEGCRLQAAGPLGVAGLSVVSLAQAGPARWRFARPVRGRWLFAAVCGKEEVALDPAVVDLSQPRHEPLILTVRR